MSLKSPGPQQFFGRYYALRSLRKRPLDFISNMANHYGDIVHFKSWKNPIFFINHPELIHEVLVSRSKDFIRADAILNALRLFDGQSILVSEGDQWRQQRRFLQQGFQSLSLSGYARKAVEYTQQMVGQWPSQGTINVVEEMSNLCMKTLCQILLGIQPTSDLAASIRILLDVRAVETGRVISAILRPPAGFQRKRKRVLTRVHRFLDELIQQRRMETQERGDILDILIRASQQDTETGINQRDLDRQIRDESIGLINASLDATSAAMSWTLCLVAQHNSVQARLREEIQRGIAGSKATVLDSIELPFAEMVVHESLRLYPPNWVLITRRSLRESTIGDYRMPKGSWLYIFPYVIHRDDRWFAAPESFHPDRFATEKFGPTQRSAYMPLGLGPHVCIGKALSTILLTSMLARMLQEFRFEPSSTQTDMEPEVGVVIRPKNSLRLIATRETAV